MKIRVITAVVGIIAVLGLVALGGWFLTSAVFVVSVLSLFEFKNMLSNVNIRVYRIPAVAALAIIVGAAGFYSIRIFFSAIVASFILLLFLVMVLKKEQMHGLIYTVLGVIYLGIGFGSLAFLRGGNELLGMGSITVTPGAFLISFALIGTWASDSFAYFAGKRFGKHRMAPHISPNKTMEGLFGGMAGTIILCLILSAGVGFFLSAAVDFSILIGFLMGVIVAVMAPMGDLFESYLKRACDVKDSGNILPGHGGMMDRFDSLLFVAPAVLLFLSLIRYGV